MIIHTIIDRTERDVMRPNRKCTRDGIKRILASFWIANRTRQVGVKEPTDESAH